MVGCGCVKCAGLRISEDVLSWQAVGLVSRVRVRGWLFVGMVVFCVMPVVRVLIVLSAARYGPHYVPLYSNTPHRFSFSQYSPSKFSLAFFDMYMFSYYIITFCLHES